MRDARLGQRGVLLFRCCIAFFLLFLLSAAAMPKFMTFWRNAMLDYEVQRLAADIRWVQEMTRTAVYYNDGMPLSDTLDSPPEIRVQETYYEIRCFPKEQGERHYFRKGITAYSSTLYRLRFTQDGYLLDRTMGTFYLTWKGMNQMRRKLVIDAIGRIRVDRSS